MPFDFMYELVTFVSATRWSSPPDNSFAWDGFVYDPCMVTKFLSYFDHTILHVMIYSCEIFRPWRPV
jgi:hypothetical protein